MWPSAEDFTNDFAVVGYDVRIPPREWERGRICSVDAIVWPSAISESLWTKSFSSGFQGLWNDCEELATASLDLESRMLIVITWSNTLARSAGLAPIGPVRDVDGIYGLPPNDQEPGPPVNLGNDWDFLGYDVADGWLMSALWNMGLNRDHVPNSLNAGFFQLLNENGLFSELEPAIEFSRIVSKLASEHAPFSPFGVWRRHFQT